jgi:seryl-tRNA synthetase
LNQNCRNNSGSGITWALRDDHGDEMSLASESIHSLSKNKSSSYHSLEEKSNHSPKSDHLHHSKDSIIEAALIEQREYIDERLRECEDKMDQTGREINEVYSKIEKNQNHSKEDMDTVLDKIMKISEEFNTSFELRAAEIRSLRNDFDEQLNMVSHLLVIYVT